MKATMKRRKKGRMAKHKAERRHGSEWRPGELSGSLSERSSASATATFKGPLPRNSRRARSDAGNRAPTRKADPASCPLCCDAPH